MFFLFGNRLIKYKVIDLNEPTGAPNAADTPAAAPPDTKSRLSVSDLKYSNICMLIYGAVLPNWRAGHNTYNIILQKLGMKTPEISYFEA